MKKLFFLTVFLILIPLASSQVFYQVDVSERSVDTDLSIKLDCEETCPVSRWSVTMNVPREAQILDVRSSRGRVDEYSKRGDEILVKTDTSPSDSEKITVSYRLERDAKELYQGLYTRTLGLPGFAGEKNSGEIRGETVHASISSGFELSAKDDSVNFTGEGPGNIYLALGDGYKAEYYEFFGSEPDNTSISYEVPVGVLGFRSRFERLPVAVMPSEMYNRTVNTWSAGQYMNATLVTRDQESLEEDFRSILAHETTHALNDQHFDWDADSSWFDEGVSRYIEYLVKKAETGEKRTRNLFWEDKRYVKQEDGSRYRYTVPSKGDKDRLWRYYQNDRDFMRYWSPEDQNRGFGYAYSELVVRNYVMRNGSLKQLYETVDDEVESDQGKWRMLSKHMDLTPCKYESRDIFEECLERVNDYDYPVYRAEDINESQRVLLVKEMEIEHTEEQRGGGGLLSNDTGELNRTDGAGSMVKTVKEFIIGLLAGF